MVSQKSQKKSKTKKTPLVFNIVSNIVYSIKPNRQNVYFYIPCVNLNLKSFP